MMARSIGNNKVIKAIAPLRVKVKFLTDCDPGGGKPVFKKDSVRELVISSANHWIRRKKAVKYTEPVKKAGKSKKAAAKLPKRTNKSRKVEVKTEPVIEEPIIEENLEEEPEKKSEDFLELPTSLPITETDSTPEIERE